MDNSRMNGSTYGIGLFCIALLSRWGTGNSLFTGTEGLLRFGIIEILAFSLAGFLAFITMIPVIQRMKPTFYPTSLIEVLQNRLSSRAWSWMRWLLMLAL